MKKDLLGIADLSQEEIYTILDTAGVADYRSVIGYSKKQKEIIKSLGITKMNQVITRPDSPAARGIVAKVPHLLRIVD